MSNTTNFGVSPNLAALLGESYRSTEAALKELVDNAWDADASKIFVSLPAALTNEPIIIKDDGHGMTTKQIQSEYLSIARDRRSAKGIHTKHKNRRVKGRKGIGKFAGLAAARYMEVVTICEGQKSSLVVDKQSILNTPADLEKIPLPLEVQAALGSEVGTTITLTHLDQAFNFPRPEVLRALLTYEYGRETGIEIYVNGRLLEVEDIPGERVNKPKTLPTVGEAKLRFTIADGKLPKHAGIVLKVGGKVVGKPQWFGLEENPEIPEGLRKRIYGIIEVEDLPDGVVTIDWGAIVESSKAFTEIAEHVNVEVTQALKSVYAREMRLRQNRLSLDNTNRLKKLPENRRKFAEDALNKILVKFYDERQERIDTIASVILDAMERDEYWQVLQQIDVARHGDVANFAEALASFGLVELGLIAERARARQKFLDQLDLLIANPSTLESEMHTALDKNLWIFGAQYSLMASNASLGTIVSTFTNKKYNGIDAANRPDLLLNTDFGERYLLIEFKRPSHSISRTDESQAQEYADTLSSKLPGKPFEVLVIGGGRAPNLITQNSANNLTIFSYGEIVSRARMEVEWLLKLKVN